MRATTISIHHWVHMGVQQTSLRLIHDTSMCPSSTNHSPLDLYYNINLFGLPAMLHELKLDFVFYLHEIGREEGRLWYNGKIVFL